MKLLADENIDAPIVKFLRANGYDILYIPEIDSGISDLEVLNFAAGEDRMLLTGDKDFGELVFRHQHSNPGVILIRINGLQQDEKSKLILTVLQKHGNEMERSFSIVTPDSIRIRKLPSLFK